MNWRKAATNRMAGWRSKLLDPFGGKLQQPTMAKKLVNATADVVEEMVQGVLAAHPGLVRLEGLHVLLRRDFAAVSAPAYAKANPW